MPTAQEIADYAVVLLAQAAKDLARFAGDDNPSELLDAASVLVRPSAAKDAHLRRGSWELLAATPLILAAKLEVDPT